MASDLVLALYDPEKETVVSTSHGSSFRLGVVLMQKQASGAMRPVQVQVHLFTLIQLQYNNNKE